VTTAVEPSGVYGSIANAPAARPGGVDLWESLKVRVDPAAWRPVLAPDIEVTTFRLRWGNDYTVIANPRALLHYRLETWEAELLPLMDGEHTIKDILVERFRESGDIELSGVADLVRALHEGGFLVEPYADVNALVGSALDPVSGARRRLRQFTRTLSIDWRGAHRMVDWFYRNGLRWFFRPAVAAVLGLVAIAGFAAFLAVPDTDRFGISGQDAAIASLVLLVMNYLLTFIHELAHATALVHYGRRVKSAGFMIYFGSPAFFIESSDGLMLDRGQRIVQSSAGPYSELIVAGAAGAFAWAYPEAAISPLLFKFALLNYFVIFLNLVPLLELDGYWILADLIQVLDSVAEPAVHPVRPVSKFRTRRFTKQEVGSRSTARWASCSRSAVATRVLLGGGLRRAIRSWAGVRCRRSCSWPCSCSSPDRCSAVSSRSQSRRPAHPGARRGPAVPSPYRLAGRGRAPDRRPADLRGPARGAAVGPRGTGAAARVPGGQARLPSGRCSRGVLHRPPWRVPGDRGGSGLGDRACAPDPGPR
jgi:Zn-dependent protease